MLLSRGGGGGAHHFIFVQLVFGLKAKANGQVGLLPPFPLSFCFQDAARLATMRCLPGVSWGPLLPPRNPVGSMRFEGRG